MFSDITILHRTGSEPFRASDIGASEALVWQTCLRSLAIGETERMRAIETSSRDERLHGLDAYKLCLEIACGLRSPLVGETEVLGQFKIAFQSFAAPAGPWGAQLKRFSRCLFEDVKKVRAAHLDSLGSQSYGSVVRREIRGLCRVHVIGAGQLVEEMLPWLAKDGVELRVHARDPLKARARLARVAVRVEVSALREAVGLSSAQAIVVAAPLGADEVTRWLVAGAARSLELIADLRANSDSDAFQFPAEASALGVSGRPRTLTLPQTLALVDSNHARLQERKRAALQHIETIAAERAMHVEYRPFGWDDVCA